MPELPPFSRIEINDAAEFIGLLDPYATEFEFRYVKVGYKKLPELGEVERAAADLMTAVRPHCRAA